MITVVGAGSIGSTIARYLSRKYDVSVIDRDENRLALLKDMKGLHGTINDYPDQIENSKVIVVALPGSVAHGVVEELLRAGKKVVDISFSNEDPFVLDEIAKSNGGLLIPDAGFAPGLSNLLAGVLHKEKKYRSIEIYVAGLPQDRKPPLEYSVTWSVEGLIDEYTRPARIILGGKVTEVDPLQDVKCFSIEGMGEYEAFYSDGLRTLLDTMPETDMFEKTLRYPGHISRIRFLRDMGFFSEDEVEGTTPRKITENLFDALKTGERDVCILIVRGIGQENREFLCIDRYDDRNDVSSMSRMTGYTAAVFAEAVLSGKVDGAGVIPPERIGHNDDAFRFIRQRLSEEGIKF